MKKLLVILSIIALALVITACGGTNSDTSQVNQSSGQQQSGDTQQGQTNQNQGASGQQSDTTDSGNDTNAPDSPGWEEHVCTFDCNDFVIIVQQEVCVLATSFEADGINDLSNLYQLTNLRVLNIGLGFVREDSDDMVRDDVPATPDDEPDVYVNVTNVIPASISPLRALTNLEELSLWVSFEGVSMSANDVLVQEVDIDALRELTNLTRLQLTAQGSRGNNTVSVVNAEALGRLTALTTLNVAGFDIRDISSFNNLANLETLSLSGETTDVSPLSNLTTLTFLDLGSNAITDVSPLSSLTNLTFLDLSRNAITYISPLTDLTNLDVLGLRGNDIQRHREALENALPNTQIIW